MLLKTLFSQRPLINKSKASIFIYLRDHDQLINPTDSRLKLSYSDPKRLAQGAPAQKFLPFKLEKDMQELLDRQVFEEYKNKILRGTIDEAPIKQSDPLWGEQEVPTHYYYRPAKIDLMRVSHPHNADAEAWLDAHYQPYFSTSIEVEVDSQLAQTNDIHKLVQISVAARKQQVTDKQLWYNIQQGFKRGKSLYLLSSQQLIKLKWAFDGLIKQGTPVFHEILASLLREDVPKMSKEQLLHLFYACKYSNPGQTNLQPEVVQKLRSFFSEFSFQQKTSFLLAYSLCTKPLKLGKKVQRRRRYEFSQKVANVLLQLDLWDLPLTNQTAAQLIFALAKLHLQNTKFISYPIRDFISENLQSYGEDLQRLYQAIVYLPQLEGGEGVLERELATRLRQLAEPRWSQFSKIQQIRIIHSLWNLGLMDEGLLQLYKGVEFQVDSSLLYYAAQIQLHTSSEREWQIIQYITALEHLPLPYFVAYKRFYNYIKATTTWNLKPLAEKLVNLQYHYNAMRQYDSLYKIRHYRKLRQFEKFTEVKFSQSSNPVQNLQLAHFAYPLHQVSLDIITKREMVPGTTELKQTYRNKMRSLKNIGWKHIVFTEGQLQELDLFNIIANVQTSCLPYVESQQAIIDYQDYQRARQLERHRQIQILRQLEIDEINEYFSIIEEKQNIILGNEKSDEEDEENSTDRIKKGSKPLVAVSK